MLKQIACIAAYATGFALGTYGACKAVKAIELRYPMKGNPFDNDFTLFKKRGTLSTLVGEGNKSVTTFTFLDGSKYVFECAPDEVDAKIKHYGFQPI